ncbi:MAG: tetratricopeptide repeat protein, partial [Planctomycetota bacterium]
MRARIVGFCFLAALLAFGAVLAQDAATVRLEMAKARDAMADRDYPLAERLLSGFIAKYQVGEMVEEAHVLLMRASMGVGDHEAALEAGRRLLTSYDDSPWERKARFLMGEAYARVRGYKDAARIYREQVDFLAGDAHERKVAGYYLELADKAYEGEERPDEFGRPKRV